MTPLKRLLVAVNAEEAYVFVCRNGSMRVIGQQPRVHLRLYPADAVDARTAKTYEERRRVLHLRRALSVRD